MPRIIDPIDNSAVMDAIETERDTPRELTEQDWQLLESLAAAGGPDGDGDLRRWGQPSTARLLQLLETPGPRLMHCVNLLLLARRDDVIEAIAEADYSGELLPAIEARCSELHTERNRNAPRGPRATEPAPAAPPGRKRRVAGQADRERWEHAQAAPQEALAAIAEVMASDSTTQSKHHQAARIIGIPFQRDGQRVMTDAEVRAELNRRLEVLGGEPLEVAEAEAVSLLAERWAECQRDPAAAIERVVAIRTGGGLARERTLAAARALGIACRDQDGRRVPAMELRAEIAERLEALEDFASGITTGPVIEAEPAAVVITPMPDPAPAAVETWELGPYPPLTAEMLLAEAWDHQPDRCTLQDRLAVWEAQDGQDLDWRVFFGALSDFAWPSAAAAISGATGIPTAEVQAWEATVRQRHQEDLAELRTAYSDLSELLADAVQQRGWQWLSAGLAIRCDSLWARARELSADPRSAA